MIGARAREALASALGDRVHFDVPLSRHTSLRIGGPADALAAPASREELARLLAVCGAHGLPHTVLGAGFNTLVLDGGLDGVAIQLSKLRRLEAVDGGVQAEAGVSHHRLTKFCVERGLSGLEFGAGIPGTIGGWVAMNAGIGSREVKDALRAAEVLRPGSDAVEWLGGEALRFRYRGLAGLPAGAVIVSALFAVGRSTPDAVQAEVDRLLAQRAEKQPLDLPSCGSVFKNPPGDFAGRLIEAAGLKGERFGGAEISHVHANFIVNRGGATAADVLALIERARAAVRVHAGVELEPEVRIVGRKPAC